jgi:hypothetical protein
MLLTTHIHLAPRSRERRAIPLPSLWALGSVTGYLYLYVSFTFETQLAFSAPAARLYKENNRKNTQQMKEMEE